LQEAAQYSAPSQIDFLRREYRKRNSLSGLLDTVGEAGLEGKNVSSMLPIAGPAGMSLLDAAKGGKLQTRFKDYITDALGALVGGVENPGLAAKGLLTDDEMLGASMQTAGTAMLGGGAAVNAMRPSGDGLLASNMPIGTKVYRQDSLTPNLPGEGAVYYSPNKSYTENYAGEGRTLKTSTVPENTVDIQTPEGRSQVVNWMQGEYNKFAKLSDDLELPRISGELKYIKDILNKENISAPDVAQAMANLTLIYNRQTGNQNSSAAEKQFLDNVGADAITMVESDGSPSLAFRFAPTANANASVGALVLSQHARAKPELADILAQNGVDPANINAAPIQRVQAALETATQRQILDPRSANSILQGFAQPELEDFYANASKSAGAAGLLASDARKSELYQEFAETGAGLLKLPFKTPKTGAMREIAIGSSSPKASARLARENDLDLSVSDIRKIAQIQRNRSRRALESDPLEKNKITRPRRTKTYLAQQKEEREAAQAQANIDIQRYKVEAENASKSRKNLLMAARAARDMGLNVKSSKDKSGKISSYYVDTAQGKVRISDHNLPWTPKREMMANAHGREGFSGFHGDEIIIGPDSTKKEITDFLKSIKKSEALAAGLRYANSNANPLAGLLAIQQPQQSENRGLLQ